MEQEIKKLTEKLQEVFSDLQKRPNQFIVLYKRKDNDELIGYHLNTFCKITKDVLKAKRYAESEPYKQLEVINKNLKHTFDKYPSESIFSPVSNAAREAFGELNYEDIYLDFEHIADGMEPQEFRITVITPDKL